MPLRSYSRLWEPTAGLPEPDMGCQENLRGSKLYIRTRKRNRNKKECSTFQDLKVAYWGCQDMREQEEAGRDNITQVLIIVVPIYWAQNPTLH